MRILLACMLFGLWFPARAGDLKVEGAWIRSAPPGASMLAGYATLRNAGRSPITVRGARSAAFAAVELHQTVESDGIARMRPLDALRIEPGASVRLEPGGRHLMLMQPRQAIAAGDAPELVFELEGGGEVVARFEVRAGAPDAAAEHAHHH
ncbi:MAG: hypothetical protein KatS3mg126_1366 [Lysobacteraceae bacterium]|nr:MAG: hypothetical protein KatS3mg126_1366 [Xanthomonadaceae bacterium]